MTEPGLNAVLATLPSVDLASVQAAAPMLARHDRKYLVTAQDAIRFVRLLPPSTRCQTIDGVRAFRYRSVYFDTPERELYLAAARRRPDRCKVRTRAYLDTGQRLLEIKHRDRRGRTVKARMMVSPWRRASIDAAGRAFLATSPQATSSWDRLEPVLQTDYVRSTLLADDGIRVTIDVDMRSSSPDGRTVRLGGVVVIETKSLRGPGGADRILWSMGHRPVPISKYCTSMAVLYPELPSNRWTRALQQGWVTADGTSRQADLSNQVPSK